MEKWNSRPRPDTSKGPRELVDGSKYSHFSGRFLQNLLRAVQLKSVGEAASRQVARADVILRSSTALLCKKIDLASRSPWRVQPDSLAVLDVRLRELRCAKRLFAWAARQRQLWSKMYGKLRAREMDHLIRRLADPSRCLINIGKHLRPYQSQDRNSSRTSMPTTSITSLIRESKFRSRLAR